MGAKLTPVSLDNLLGQMVKNYFNGRGTFMQIIIMIIKMAIMIIMLWWRWWCTGWLWCSRSLMLAVAPCIPVKKYALLTVLYSRRGNLSMVKVECFTPGHQKLRKAVTIVLTIMLHASIHNMSHMLWIHDFLYSLASTPFPLRLLTYFTPVGPSRFQFGRVGF